MAVGTPPGMRRDEGSRPSTPTKFHYIGDEHEDMEGIRTPSSYGMLDHREWNGWCGNGSGGGPGDIAQFPATYHSIEEDRQAEVQRTEELKAEGDGHSEFLAKCKKVLSMPTVPLKSSDEEAQLQRVVSELLVLAGELISGSNGDDRQVYSDLQRVLLRHRRYLSPRVGPLSSAPYQ